ncbi:sex pilus assembly protein TrhG [Pseudomonas luteola]|uniref:Sex pilus assembly protein TrhG n=1 Tax=Pseudomonas luteola TaxID=47886 RepID=A0A2X2C480_PSELU|nr:conjugal transfer protein TraG N-terminal domain-containing protein [Pseudomonas luteola]SPZ00356.1 sex pilus assembly protein TrhG [Pseudomonas luteola]
MPIRCWARTNEAFSTPTVKNAIAESAGIKLFEDDDLYTRLNTGVSALSTAGAAAVEAQKYVMALCWIRCMPKPRKVAIRICDFSSAAMVSQAIQQRNTQWASEQTMFLSTVRPMLALIEGFVYAVTPLMGFLIVMGAFGIKLVGKYIQMLIWIQLWMPVLAIINLYLYMAASAELAADAGATSGVAVALDSFYGLYRSDEILANWLATGGMLAAATPVLTLMLVTGSTYAWASLARA